MRDIIAQGIAYPTKKLVQHRPGGLKFPNSLKVNDLTGSCWQQSFHGCGIFLTKLLTYVTLNSPFQHFTGLIR